MDNLSGLPVWLSDEICRLATGGGLSTRELYTNDEEAIFDICRPVVLNGIEGVITRGDLASRALVFVLPAISHGQRRSEADFWCAFDRAHSPLLAALLDVIVGALRHLPNVHLPELPRLADFALWGTAIELHLGWPVGSFVRALNANQGEQHRAQIENSSVAQALVSFVSRSMEAAWTGTTERLLAQLNTTVMSLARQDPSWPRTPKKLSGILRRLAPSLRGQGWTVQFPDPNARPRVMTLAMPQNPDVAGGSSSSTFGTSGDVHSLDARSGSVGEGQVPQVGEQPSEPSEPSDANDIAHFQSPALGPRRPPIRSGTSGTGQGHANLAASSPSPTVAGSNGGTRNSVNSLEPDGSDGSDDPSRTSPSPSGQQGVAPGDSDPVAARPGAPTAPSDAPAGVEADATLEVLPARPRRA